MSELKPFHESIVDAIDQAESVPTMTTLGQLILSTKIPKNHDAIIAAWVNQEMQLGMNHDPSIIKSVGLQVPQPAEAESEA